MFPKMLMKITDLRSISAKGLWCRLGSVPHIHFICLGSKRKNFSYCSLHGLISLQSSLQGLSVSSPSRWRSPAPCPHSSRRCWRTRRVWKVALQAAGLVVPPQAAAAPVCPLALPKAVQPHNHRSSGPRFYFPSQCFLSPPSTSERRGAKEGGGGLTLTVEHRRLAEPTSSSATTQIPTS